MVEYHRFALDYLEIWKSKSTRLPLVIRGPRQVGKSFLVRMFGHKAFEDMLEINFELSSEAVSLFQSKSPQKIIPMLEAMYKTRIRPGKTLLFLDEIQAAPDVFASLRYFKEQMPLLHIIAAGSLLEFIHREHSFSMPVGRIEYLHLGPMRFEEFLLARGEEQLLHWLQEYSIGMEIPAALHHEGLKLVKQFCVCGGLPDAVRAFADDLSGQECAAVQQGVLATFRDDFAKYAGKVKRVRIQKVFDAVPRLIGRKFMYSHVDREERSRDLKKALELLCLARVISRVYHTHANGIPLGSEIEESVFKVLFLDVGLLCRSLGLGVIDFEKAENLLLVNRGAVCEQFIGQELLYANEFFDDPVLYCWIRQKRQSSAEIDYVRSLGEDVFPVEVKAGKTGTLKSLHLFLREKKREFGLRFNSDVPSFIAEQTGLTDGTRKTCRLLSLPLYLVGQFARLCEDSLGRRRG